LIAGAEGRRHSNYRLSRLGRPLQVGIASVPGITKRSDLLPYNEAMSLIERVQKDMVDAMRKKEELRLSTIRMMKAALQNKRIEKRADLDEKEELQVLSTMIKQRKDSIEQFEKGNRPELAAKEAAEIAIIEGYMPKAVGEEEIVAAVRAVITEMGSPTMKDMGVVMKNAKAKFGGARVDGKLLSEEVKKQLAGSN
jgi:uncharacterized protein YqeY